MAISHCTLTRSHSSVNYYHHHHHCFHYHYSSLVLFWYLLLSLLSISPLPSSSSSYVSSGNFFTLLCLIHLSMASLLLDFPVNFVSLSTPRLWMLINMDITCMPRRLYEILCCLRLNGHFLYKSV